LRLTGLLDIALDQSQRARPGAAVAGDRIERVFADRAQISGRTMAEGRAATVI